MTFKEKVKEIFYRGGEIAEKLGTIKNILLMVACTFLAMGIISIIFQLAGTYKIPAFLNLVLVLIFALLFYYKFAYEMLVKGK